MAFDIQTAELEQTKLTVGSLQAELAAQATAAASFEQRAAQAEASNIGTDKVLRHAQEEIKMLHSLLHTSQGNQEQSTRQLQLLLASQVETAQHNLIEQTCLSEQLGQLRQETEQLRAQLQKQQTAPAISAVGRSRKKLPVQDVIKRKKPANREGE